MRGSDISLSCRAPFSYYTLMELQALPRLAELVLSGDSARIWLPARWGCKLSWTCSRAGARCVSRRCTRRRQLRRPRATPMRVRGRRRLLVRRSRLGWRRQQRRQRRRRLQASRVAFSRQRWQSVHRDGHRPSNYALWKSGCNQCQLTSGQQQTTVELWHGAQVSQLPHLMRSLVVCRFKRRSKRRQDASSA